MMTSPVAASGLDGATALIRPNGLPGESHFRPDQVSYYVRVAIFTGGALAWSQVADNATLHVLIPEAEYSVEHNVSTDPLRVFVDADATVKTWVETAAIPFTTATAGNVQVRIPNEAITKIDGTFVNLVRVYVELSDGRVSHHNVAKNDLILNGLYDAADALDGVYSPALAT